jgi:urocanate hydratase
MTAGSWIYIGSQGILQGTYETFKEAAKVHFLNDGSLKGKIVLTAGLGGMGGAQALAVTMLDGVCLAIEVDEDRAQKRKKTKYLDIICHDVDEAITLALDHKKKMEKKSIALIGNAADVYPILWQKGFMPDMITDQTSAHDPLWGYMPSGISLDKLNEERKKSPAVVVEKARVSMAKQVSYMLKYYDAGVPVFDYGNNLRAEAQKGGCEKAFLFKGFVESYIRPLFCEGLGPFRFVALSGESQDIYTADKALIDLFPHNQCLKQWLGLAKEYVSFQGLPARICWLGYGERSMAGLCFNNLVKQGKIKAPIVIGRDHLDCGSVASPYRETEGMLDGSDAVADWPILNALANTACGAAWVSFHHGGGVGMGYSLHAGQVCVADGSVDAENRISKVLNADPGLGIMRHADAGYDKAKEIAIKRQVMIPGITR